MNPHLCHETGRTVYPQCLQIEVNFLILKAVSPASIAGLFFEKNCMSSELLEKLRELADPIVEERGAYIVDLNVRGERSSKVVELFIDSEEGITVDDCSVVSREFSTVLDTHDVIKGRYRLDVSSPDLNRPLKHIRQYKKNIGRKIKLTYSEDSVVVNCNGTLASIDEEKVVITNERKNIAVPLNDIIEAFIVPQFK